jgi:3-hydroxyacyl-[acyl-carrier-protein] dehydratase
MPPPLLFDPKQLDLSGVAITKEQIYEVLPHRYEFSLLDGISYLDAQTRRCVGFKDVRSDEWWTKGHIPGRPLLPGVLMIEAAAQLASYFTSFILKDNRFWGFGGVDQVKFRDAVTPPSRLYLIGVGTDIRPRRLVCQVQGLVDETMVFEATLTGMPV